MPKLDGISAAEQIATARIAPVVMLTAFSQRELVDRASQAGAMAYVVKPFGKADLIPAIEIARARFAEIQAVEAEVSDLTERLESRKAVDRAKGLLQTGLGPDRAGGVPLDPEDGDGPAQVDARGRRRCHRARLGRQEEVASAWRGAATVTNVQHDGEQRPQPTAPDVGFRPVRRVLPARTLRHVAAQLGGGTCVSNSCSRGRPCWPPRWPSRPVAPRAEESGTGGTGENATKVAKIGVIAPLSGDLSALGLGIQNSVDLAIKQANEKGTIPGWTLEVDAQDDQAKPDVGKNAATKLAGDDEVVGVVGTLNSSVAQSVQPVLASAEHRADLAGQHRPVPHPRRGPGEPPEARVPELLPHLHHRRGPGSVRGQVPPRRGHQERRHHPRQEGLRPGPGRGVQPRPSRPAAATIVAAETINPDDKDFSAVISKVKGANPEAVYYGGEYPQAGPLSAAGEGRRARTSR